MPFVVKLRCFGFGAFGGLEAPEPEGEQEKVKAKGNITLDNDSVKDIWGGGDPLLLVNFQNSLVNFSRHSVITVHLLHKYGDVILHVHGFHLPSQGLRERDEEVKGKERRNEKVSLAGALAVPHHGEDKAEGLQDE